MATTPGAAVPLCYPDNHAWDSSNQTLSIDDEAPPAKKVLLCEDGIAILKEIDTPVVVVCVTGPASSGKSYLLSQIQNGGNFPVHHGRISSTSGIWITAARQQILKDGREARLIFLDTEGFQSLYNEDSYDGTIWERKLFLLSLLMSSFFIFNNPGKPSFDDLCRLKVLTSFGNILVPQKQRRPRDPQVDAPADFLWLVRDESRRPNLRGQSCNWATFMKSTLLQRRENDCDDEREMTRIALIRTFGKIDAFAMPPPSYDPDVMRKLDSREIRQTDLDPAFIRSVQLTTNKIIASARVKTIAGTPISGKRLAVLLHGYVDALNRQGGMVDVESSWACMVASESAVGVYSASMRTILDEMPCDEQKVKSCHVDAREEASKHFISGTRSKVNSPQVVEFYQDCLSGELQNELKSYISRNEQLSRNFCRDVKSGVYSKYLQPISNNLSNATLEDATDATGDAMSAYTQQARGPAKASICEELESASGEILEHVKRIEAQKCIRLSSTSYQTVMLELQLPCGSSAFEDKHKSAVSEAERVFSREFQGVEEEDRSLYHNELMNIIQNERSSFVENNYCLSVEACEKLVEDLKAKHLSSLKGYLGYDHGYDDLLSAVNKIFEEYDTKATGPKKEHVKSQAKEKMDAMLRNSQDQLIMLGVRKAKEWYNKMLRNLQLPATEEAVYRNLKCARKCAVERFGYYTRGIPSNIQEKELSKVSSQLDELSSLRKLENERLSRPAASARPAQPSQRGSAAVFEDPKPLTTAAVVGGVAVAVGLAAYGIAKLFSGDNNDEEQQRHRSRQRQGRNNRRY